MPNEIQTFQRRKQLERDGDERDDLVEVARPGGAQKGLQLRKRQFDRIEVRAVGRQKAEPCADRFDRGLDLRLFVRHEVVEHDDVARTQRRDEDLLDVREKRGIVDRAVEDGRGGEAVHA